MNETFVLFMISFTIFSSTIIYSTSTKCLENKNSVKWRRQFHVDNRTLPIIIAVTNRKSHRIISFILKILLIEKLHYRNVIFKEIPWLSTETTMQMLYNKDISVFPDAHINLELWQPPGFNVETFVNEGLVIDCGPLGPVGRRGIFTASSTVEMIFEKHSESVDHWRIFENLSDNWNYSELYKWLTVNKSWVTLDDYSPRDVINTPIILIDNTELRTPLKKLFGSVFTKNLSNVILMTNSSGSLHQTIDEWFQYISTRPDLVVKSPLFFYDWYPNTITVQRKYNRVLFPDCYEIKDNPLCDFEVNQLSKMVWAKLKTHALLVYQLVNQFKFPESDLVELLKQVKNENTGDNDLFKIACNWLKEDKWFQWIDGWDVKQQLVIPGLYSLYGKWIPGDLVNVSYREVQNLNKMYFDNTSYELVIDIRNLSCVEDLVLKEYLQYSSSSNSSAIVVAYLAAVCSDSLESTLKVSTFQRRIVVTSTADSPNFGNDSQYKYFYRTIPSMELQKVLLLETFREWNWKRVVILRKDSMFFDTDYFLKNGIKILEDPKLDENMLTFSLALQTLKRIRDQKNGRIFIVEYFAEATRLVMCAAYKLHMTLENGFVWLLNPWMNSNWNEQGTDNCLKKEILNVTYSYLILPHIDITTDNGNKNGQYKIEETTRNHFAIFTVKAIRRIGKALNRLLKENPSALSVLHDGEVTKKFKTYIKNIKQHNNQMTELTEEQWVLIGTIGSNRYPMKRWKIHSNVYRVNSNTFINKPIRKVKDPFWGEKNNFFPPSDGSKEDNESECIFGFNKLIGLSCSSTILVLNALILVPILLIIILCFCFFFQRLRKRQEEEGIKKPFEFLCQELADLDIPGEDVVINRTVGKGNFGIVYGGEARQDNHWVLVAIKAISKKLDYRFKYEFLSEAKLMSNLNHENIVKLVGVSLNPNNDMIYLIMEHVTGGDLKKFLIKRRVKAKEDPNNDKINPRRLTKYARDIASGLSYLHNNRYLHRDVACRNCLVNAEYGIKLGDFGLARRIAKFNRKDGTGYYQFSGLGAMPIRWLPPESLQFGIYSVATDIWSFGVTLYEIVTFGVFPFGGFDHEEVVDKVKRGSFNVANFLPQDCKNKKVYSIINKCCSYSPSDRFKTMQKIIEIFDQDPESIAPLLSDNPPNLPNSGMSYHSNVPMSEPSHVAHRKLTIKLPKDPVINANELNPFDSQKTNLSSDFTTNDSFFNNFLTLNTDKGQSVPVNVDRHIPNKSQSVEYIHLANTNGDYQFSNNANNGDQESDLGYVTYKTNENQSVNQETNTSSSNRPTNLTSKLPSNYLKATTDKTDQFDNTNNPATLSSDMRTKPVTNHSCSLDLSTDTGVSEIDCMIDKQFQTPLSSDIPLIDQCFQTSV